MKAIRVNSLPIRRSLPILGGLLATTLTACASLTPSPRPVLDRLAIAGITIVPTSVGDADASDREWFQEILADQATAAVRQISIDKQLAQQVEPEGSQTEALLLSGTLAIPIALPPEYRGSHAFFQKGALAVARMELRDSNGTLLTTVEATVHWKDVRWTRGSHKTRRARRIESFSDRCHGASDGTSSREADLRGVRRVRQHLPSRLGSDDRRREPNGGGRFALDREVGLE